MGQANAARDKLYDLRQCQLSGAKANGYDLSGVIMSETDVSKASFVEAYFSKGYLQSKCECGDKVYVISTLCVYRGSQYVSYAVITIALIMIISPLLWSCTFRQQL
jgi:Pentapeptide repeats (8 copies)